MIRGISGGFMMILFFLLRKWRDTNLLAQIKLKKQTIFTLIF